MSEGTMIKLGLFCWNGLVMEKKMGQRGAVEAVFAQVPVPAGWQCLSIPSIALCSSLCAPRELLGALCSLSDELQPQSRTGARGDLSTGHGPLGVLGSLGRCSGQEWVLCSHCASAKVDS